MAFNLKRNLSKIVCSRLGELCRIIVGGFVIVGAIRPENLSVSYVVAFVVFLAAWLGFDLAAEAIESKDAA